MLAPLLLAAACGGADATAAVADRFEPVGPIDLAVERRFRAEYPAAADRIAAAFSRLNVTAVERRKTGDAAEFTPFWTTRYAARGPLTLRAFARDVERLGDGEQIVRVNGPAAASLFTRAPGGLTALLSLDPPAGDVPRDEHGAPAEDALRWRQHWAAPFAANTEAVGLELRDLLRFPTFEITAAAAGVDGDGAEVVRIGWRHAYAGGLDALPVEGTWTFLPARGWVLAEQTRAARGRWAASHRAVRVAYDPPGEGEIDGVPVPLRVETADVTATGGEPAAARVWSVVTRTALGPAPDAAAFTLPAHGLPDLDPVLPPAAGGEVVAVVPPFARPLAVLEDTTATVTVRNGSDAAVSLVGANSRCAKAACVFAEADWPVRVPAGGTATVAVTFRPRAAGPVTETLDLFTDDPARPRVRATFTAVAGDAAE